MPIEIGDVGDVVVTMTMDDTDPVAIGQRRKLGFIAGGEVLYECGELVWKAHWRR